MENRTSTQDKYANSIKPDVKRRFLFDETLYKKFDDEIKNTMEKFNKEELGQNRKGMLNFLDGYIDALRWAKTTLSCDHLGEVK